MTERSEKKSALRWYLRWLCRLIHSRLPLGHNSNTGKIVTNAWFYWWHVKMVKIRKSFYTIKRKLVKSAGVVVYCVVKAWSFTRFLDDDFTTNSGKGFYLYTNINHVSSFRVLSINQYLTGSRLSLLEHFLQRSRVNSFADTFIFRIDGPRLSINIRFSQLQTGCLFGTLATLSSFQRSRGKYRKGWQCLQLQGLRHFYNSIWTVYLSTEYESIRY